MLDKTSTAPSQASALPCGLAFSMQQRHATPAHVTALPHLPVWALACGSAMSMAAASSSGVPLPAPGERARAGLGAARPRWRATSSLDLRGQEHACKLLVSANMILWFAMLDVMGPGGSLHTRRIRPS